MNSLILAGSLILGWNGAAHTVTDTTEHEPVYNRSEVQSVTDLNQIAFVEDIYGDQGVELGFDTAEYLPEGFDPYVGNLDDIVYVEAEEVVVLGFDTAEYLPEGFDAYVGDFNAIAYAEKEENVILDFDTAAWLPEGFDPHLGNINDLAYAEEPLEVELGFDTTAYLPEHFDPHVGDLDRIVYKELDYHFLRKFHATETMADNSLNVNLIE